jgi:hypothetical protein
MSLAVAEEVAIGSVEPVAIDGAVAGFVAGGGIVVVADGVDVGIPFAGFACTPGTGFVGNTTFGP